MKKVCLAAFGYDVGFDVNTFVDAAYSVPFKTSAAIFSSEGAKGKREFLGFDPTTFESLYEYRAAWTIMAGCDIESYSIDLAAITDSEKRKFNLDCSAVGNVEPGSNGCDNFGVGSSERTRPFASGSGISQGAYIDENKGDVVSDTHRYDHFKITLNLAPEWDAEKCFPSENRIGDQGVFYFPIFDSTAKDILQCSVSFQDGRFICSTPGLGGLGRAWIESTQCQDPVSLEWKDCERIEYSAAPTEEGVYDKVKVRANVFSSGNKLCLKSFVETTRSGKQPRADGQNWYEIIGIGQPQTVPIEMELVDKIDNSKFSGQSRYNIIPQGSLNILVDEVPTELISGFKIYFATKNSSKAGKLVGVPEYYHVKVGKVRSGGQIADPVSGDWKSISPDLTISDPSGKFKFKVTNVNWNYSKSSPGWYYTEPIDIALGGGTYTEQTWTINLELFHPDKDSLCTSNGVIKVRAPSGLAFKPERRIPIKVKQSRDETAEKTAFNKGLGFINQNNFVEAVKEFEKVIIFRSGEITEVLGYYYYVIAQIDRGSQNANEKQYAQDIKNKVVLFDARAFDQTIISSPEYHLVSVYLNEIYKELYSDESITPPTGKSSDNCIERNNCIKIDTHWNRARNLLDVKPPNNFYDPTVPDWVNESKYMLEPPYVGTEDFEKYRADVLNDINNAIAIENQLLVLLNKIEPKDNVQSASKALEIIGDSSRRLIREEEEFRKNIESRLYSVKPEEAAKIRGDIEIFTSLPKFINFLYSTKNNMSGFQTNTQFEKSLIELIRKLNKTIEEKRSSYIALDLSPQCTAASGFCTESVELCNVLGTQPIWGTIVIYGKDCPTNNPICCSK
jgi:hypothetical protein